MAIRPVSQLSDTELWRSADTLETQERTAMAQLLACIAELDARKLFADAGYASMHACCMERWRMSEDMASRRINVAKKGRRFPVIFQGLADGRFHLTGLGLLAHHLTESNADEVLAEAVNKTKREIEHLIARRFPQADVPTVLVPVVAHSNSGCPQPDMVRAGADDVLVSFGPSTAPTRMEAASRAPAPASDVCVPGAAAPHASEPAQTPTPSIPVYPRLTPRAPERYALQLTMDQETHDLLREAQALSNQPAQSEIPEVLKRALRLYVAKLKQRKLGASSRPQKKQRRHENVRTIPAAVRRAVVARDGNQCMYVSESGKRCRATTGLEFDHIVPVASGGESTVDNIRRLCKTHNQLEAERVFGAEFMAFKREEARLHNDEKAVASARAPAST